MTIAKNIEIDVQYGDDLSDTERANLPNPQQIIAWAEAALAGIRAEAQLTVRIVSGAEGAMLNQTYRHKQGATNVLSFAVEDADELPVPLLGDIAVCAPVVEREAREQGKEAAAHWAHMVVHGTLHLLGYDHLDDAQAKKMESLETRILAGLGFPNPYNEELINIQQ